MLNDIHGKMGNKINYFYYVCCACNWVNCSIDKDDQWSYFLRIIFLGEVDIMGGMIALGNFSWLLFSLFIKTGKIFNYMDGPKNLENISDSYGDWFELDVFRICQE